MIAQYPQSLTYSQKKVPTKVADFSLPDISLIVHFITLLMESNSQLPPPCAPTGKFGFLAPPGRIPLVSPETLAETEVTLEPKLILTTTFSSGRE
jgi:hypothetical protein